jgi:CHAD domain-containing protein
MGDKPALRPDVAVSRALKKAAAKVLEEALAPLADRTLPDAKVVHDVRKALKRWRALLRLMEDVLGEEARALRVRARDLARSLAQARDPRSALDALADLGESPSGLPTRSLAALRNRLERTQEKAETAILTPKMRSSLRGELTETAEAVGRWSLGDPTFEDVASALTKTYQRARDATPQEWESATADDLHELRKRVVEHRYQMELIEPLWPKLGRLWVSEAQRLRDRLGRHHDLTVLAGLMRRSQPLAPWRSRLAPMVQARQREHVRAAARLAGRLFAEKPNAFRTRLVRLWDSRADAMAE